MNDKRWQRLLDITEDYVDKERLEMGLDKGLHSHIVDEAETVEELLEALEAEEIPRYVVFGLNVADYEGYLGHDEHGYFAEDFAEIEELAARMAEKGLEVDAFDLDTGRSVGLDVRLKASVRVTDA